MDHRRRRMMAFAGAAALATAFPARAADYPTRPVRVIVPVAPGGALDINARIIAQWLSEKLGQPFIVENKPGASTNIAVDYVARAAPDGYTLLLVPGSVTVNVSLFDKLNFVFLRDIAPVAMISILPLVMEVNLAVPAKTVSEFIAYAKTRPGKISMGTSGVGTPHHMAGELFNQRTGLDMTPVAYGGGGPGLVGLIGDQTQIMFSPLPESIGAIKAGQVRALAVTTAKRLDALPETPTVAETLPGYEANSWQGIGAPTGTSPEIVARLNGEINAALADARTRASLADLGSIPTAMSPDGFKALIAAQTDTWRGVIRAANMKAP